MREERREKREEKGGDREEKREGRGKRGEKREERAPPPVFVGLPSCIHFDGFLLWCLSSCINFEDFLLWEPLAPLLRRAPGTNRLLPMRKPCARYAQTMRMIEDRKENRENNKGTEKKEKRREKREEIKEKRGKRKQ